MAEITLINSDIEILEKNKKDEVYKKIELAGRTSYKSEKRITENSAEKFIRMLLRRGHESVLEHHSITVKFIIDRGISHELVRHRIASYTQESTRYVNYNKKDEYVFIKPETLNDEQINVFKKALRQSVEMYNKLIQDNVKPEIARNVLPNALKTEVVTTMNIRSWRNFFNLRTDITAHPQMRIIACKLLNLFKKEYPALFDDIKGNGCIE